MVTSFDWTRLKTFYVSFKLLFFPSIFSTVKERQERNKKEKERERDRDYLREIKREKCEAK